MTAIKWWVAAVAAVVLAGGIIWWQHGVIGSQREAIGQVQEKLAGTEKALAGMTAERDAAVARTQALADMTQSLDRWKATQDAANAKILSQIRQALKDNECAPESVPDDVIRLQQERAAGIRERAGVPAVAQ